MIILLSGLFITGVALAVYALVPFQWGGKKPQESPPASILPEPLEQLNVERQNLQTELELANNVARQLQEELAKFKESAGNAPQLQELKESKEKLELAQKDNQQLAQKIKGLEEQSAVYVKEIEGQRAVNSDLLNKLKVLGAQLQEYKQEIEKQKTIIQPPATAAHEQVSKEELESAKKDNQQLTEKIKALEEQSAVYVKEIEKYKQQIEKQKEAVQQPAPVEEQVSKPVPMQEQVSKKKYDELKKKLEEAEKVLRILHGADK